MLRKFKRALAGNSRAGIALDGAQAGLARVRRLGDGRLSLAVRVLTTEGGDREWPDRAASHAASMDLKRTPVSAVLAEDAYQLQLVEMPNVPADELLAAVRWRLKDLIDFPVEEAVVELLEMPRHANPGNAPIAYAVVTRRSEVLQQIELMKRADLQMDVIDIPELCIRNIAVLLPQDADGVAFLHFTENCGYLTITRKGILHMTRRLETGRRELAAASTDKFALQERIASISLEVQRSLDYYESHYDCRPVTEIVLGPGADLDVLPAALTEHLGLTVNRLGLEDLFILEDDVSAEEQGGSLLAVGAALRPHPSAQQVAAA
jgi:MSHA biogenesis protein MshI